LLWTMEDTEKCPLKGYKQKRTTGSQCGTDVRAWAVNKLKKGATKRKSTKKSKECSQEGKISPRNGRETTSVRDYNV